MRRDETNRHLLPKYVERARLEHAQAKVLAQAVLETGQRLPSASDQLWALADDPGRLLRGLPAIGRGVTGAIRGSIPHSDGLRD